MEVNAMCTSDDAALLISYKDFIEIKGKKVFLSLDTDRMLDEAYSLFQIGINAKKTGKSNWMFEMNS